MKKNNIVYITLKLENGKKFEHVYVLKNRNTKNKDKNIKMKIDEIINKIETMDIDNN